MDAIARESSSRIADTPWETTLEWAFGVTEPKRDEYTVQQERFGVTSSEFHKVDRAFHHFRISEIPLRDGRTIVPKSPPYAFYFTSDVESPRYKLHNEKLRIYIYSDNQEDLEIMLHDQIAIHWEEFVMCQEEMTPGAKELKDALLDIFEIKK